MRVHSSRFKVQNFRIKDKGERLKEQLKYQEFFSTGLTRFIGFLFFTLSGRKSERAIPLALENNTD
jgi:hypothetical protein